MENIIEVNQSNIETEHICCAIGNDPVNRRRADDKKAWMDQRRGDGHRFIKADLRGKVFAEFEPAENAWAPIRADGYQFIQCLWASGRYQGKGYGRELIDRVKTEVLAADPHCRGLVIISSNKKRPFMVAPGFLHAMGFSPVDHGEPWFDLYALKFDVDAPDPRFEDRARQAEIIGENGERPKGFDFFYSRDVPLTRIFPG
jgi:GNAT superfamily N-acetyltransferase